MALASDEEELTSLPMTALQGRGFDASDYPFSFNEPNPSVYFQTQALLFQQVPDFGGQPIVVDFLDNTTLLSTSALEPNFNPGVQATLGRRLRNGQAIEFDYMGLFGETKSAFAVRPDSGGFLVFPNDLPGNVFFDMDQVHVDYRSSFNSFALNLFNFCNADRGTSCDGGGCDGLGGGGLGGRAAHRQSLSWFGGFRYINFRDRVNISASRQGFGGIENGTYNTRTNNNLYGAQLGARLRRTSGRFGWDTTGFAGIFGNDASQTQTVTDFPNLAIRPTVSSHSGNVAFVGGGNLSGLYSLNNVWNFRAGYSALWVEGLALAPNQLDYNFASAQGGTALHNRGGMLLHGATVGLEARW